MRRQNVTGSLAYSPHIPGITGSVPALTANRTPHSLTYNASTRSLGLCGRNRESVKQVKYLVAYEHVRPNFNEEALKTYLKSNGHLVCNCVWMVDSADPIELVFATFQNLVAPEDRLILCEVRAENFKFMNLLPAPERR